MNLKVKSKKQLAVIIISAVIITAIGITAVVSFSNAHKVDDKFWNGYQLSKNMPKPEFKVEHKNVHEYEDKGMLVFSAKISREEYSEYLKKCKKVGFTHDAYNDNSYFAKYNDKGDLISINIFDSDSKVYFRFYKRRKLNKINWPTYNECSKLLPVPKSKYGEIQEDDSESLVVLIGKTSYSDYKKYVSKVMEINKTDKDIENEGQYQYNYYSDDSNDKYDSKKIEIEYLGNKMMRILVNVSKKEESTTSKDEVQKNESPKDVETSNIENSSITNKDSTSTTTKADNSGVRPEVKKAIDDYETFMKSYVAFMKKYQNSDDVTSMLKDYNDMMTKYSDMTSQFNSLQSKYQLNEAELDYYLEAQNRISDMMMEI